MPRSDEHALENLIRRSEELIQDISIMGAPGRPALEYSPPEGTPPEAQVDPSTDGTVDVVVSKDEMAVRVSFHPPTGDGKPVTLDAVRQAIIEGKGVTAGIDWEAIKGCIQTCNEERVLVSDAVIARGRAPVDEVPPYLVLAEEFRGRQQKETTATARVDFKELSLFTLVKKGQVLATLVPKQEGAMGTTVRGASVAFRKDPYLYPKAGKNTEWQSGYVVARCDGKLQVTPTSFWVDEVLDVQGDVDLRVGNIDFPGDVVIRGELRDGFVVKVGKSLLCQRSIGAARVECKGDLVTSAGILGKEKAVIRVGGAAEAKFIEGCSLDCGGPLRVRTSIVNSTIHTRDRVEMGERGIIIGGIVKAAFGVSAAQIGSERGPRTEIHCGLDFDIERKLIWIRDKNIALAFKLREVETKMKTTPSSQKVLAPLRDKIKAAIHSLNESARDLVAALDRNENAEVSVREVVFPGTYIEICHVSYFVTKPRRFVTFRLDKTSGKVVEQKWEKKKETGDVVKTPPVAKEAFAPAAARL
jgi:uncharacterized protein (DUF342 family)